MRVIVARTLTLRRWRTSKVRSVLRTVAAEPVNASVMGVQELILIERKPTQRYAARLVGVSHPQSLRPAATVEMAL
ncbi:MAG: hypothetical protein JWL90_2292 [Chthoniobacteraceae bacterium]|nr:hypothetical protein [Chthoniobacteraceae bacterium]